jgi:hypothetical protein
MKAMLLRRKPYKVRERSQVTLAPLAHLEPGDRVYQLRLANGDVLITKKKPEGAEG